MTGWEGGGAFETDMMCYGGSLWCHSPPFLAHLSIMRRSLYLRFRSSTSGTFGTQSIIITSIVTSGRSWHSTLAES